MRDHTPQRSLNSIDDYVHGELQEEIQDETQATHCSKIKKEDGEIDLLSSRL